MNEIETIKPKPEVDTFTFQNVAMYRRSEFLGGVVRQNCRTVEVTTGQKFAQYDDAIKVVYMEAGKRKARAFILAERGPWLRVCSLKDAIQPESAMIPAPSVSGMTINRSRYTSFDPRYMTEFEDAAEAAGVNWLIAIGSGEREGEHLERCRKIHPDVEKEVA